MKDTWLVIEGNPATGFTNYGPFESEDEAIQWADENHPDTEWWVTTLYAPVPHANDNEE